MSSRDDHAPQPGSGMNSKLPARSRRAYRPRRPRSIRGWLLWVLIILLFYLLISYVLVPWWYRPVPTDVPPTVPNSNTGRT